MASTRKSIKGIGAGGMHTGRRNRQQTMLSIRKAKKEDAYATRRHLKANHIIGDASDLVASAATTKKDTRKDLLQNIATRSHGLLLGLQHRDPTTRQKSMRGFVYLLSSGIPPLFDSNDSQHIGLWETILAAVPWFVVILKEALKDGKDLQLHCDAAFALRFIASMDKASTVIQSGAVSTLVNLFQSGISELQIQVAWCLGNIASESSDCCAVVFQACPPTMVLPHIRMSTPSLRRAAVWLLRNLVDYPDVLVITREIKHTIVETLSSLLIQLASDKVRQYTQTQNQSQGQAPMETNGGGAPSSTIAPWRIFELKTGNPPPNDIAIVRVLRPVSETMVQVIDVDINFETGENMVLEVPLSSLRPMQVMEDVGEEDEDGEDDEEEQVDEQVLTMCDSCWTLVELSVEDKEMIGWIVQSDVCNRLVEVLGRSQSSVMIGPILRLFGNIVSSDVVFSQAMIEAGLLEVMPRVMTHTSRAVREEAAWMLSNIAGGNVDHVRAMIDTVGVVSSLLEQMAWAEHSVKREATWAICNVIVQATPEYVAEMIRMRVLESFCPLLEEWEDPMVELVILEAMEALLYKTQMDGRVAVEESGCLARLEELCYDRNEELSRAATQIMDKWFTGHEHEQENDIVTQTAPQTVVGEGGQTQIQFQPVQVQESFHFGRQ